jgi:hypothetical protein
MNTVEQDVMPKVTILIDAGVDVGPRWIGHHLFFAIDLAIFKPVEILRVAAQKTVDELALFRFDIKDLCIRH